MSDSKEQPDYLPSVKSIDAIMVTYLAGSGIGPDDPARRPTAYFDRDGKLLAMHDPFADNLRADRLQTIKQQAEDARNKIAEFLETPGSRQTLSLPQGVSTSAC